VHLKLQESYCIPILSYAAAAVKYTTRQEDELNASWNSVYRRIFGFNRWESVRAFRQVRPAPHLHATTSEFSPPSEIYGSQYFKQYFMVECTFQLFGLDLTVCMHWQNKSTIIRRIYENVEST